MQAKPTTAFHTLAAFLTGGLLSLMVLFNGTLAVSGSLFFASWVPHLTGTLAALVFWRHKANIARLLRGEEPRIGQKEH